MSRGRDLIRSQRPGPSLGPPPSWLSTAEVEAWHELVAASPARLHFSDSVSLELYARRLAAWRAQRTPDDVRTLYRFLGDLFIPMRKRRELLFPERRGRIG